MPRGDFDQAYLKSILHYDPHKGEWPWTWLVTKNHKSAMKGDLAGTIEQHGNYLKIRINRKEYPSSNLAWLYMTGKWPTKLVDHKDRNSMNDRWDNFREVTHSQNAVNTDFNPKRWKE